MIPVDSLAVKLRKAAVMGLAKTFPSGFPACLMYHSIGGFSPTFCVDEPYFRDHLRFLKETRRILSLERFLQKGNIESDEALLTFDDGYLDNYEIVAKQAEALNVPVLLFITLELMGKPFFRGGIPLMDRAQVREISGWKNVSLGSHSLSHPKLKGAPIELQKREIADSKKALEDLIGKEVVSFCYPHGSYGPETVELVKAAGYAAAFTTRIGALKRNPSLEIERIPVNRFSQSMLPQIMTKGYLKYVGIKGAFA